jgi:hypothetical protein
MYAGGLFTSIGGQLRHYIAELDGTGAATAWDPSGNMGGVFALAYDGSNVYAEGSFTVIGGQARNYLAALDVGTGAATGWNPNPNNSGTALLLSGGTVFCGGFFTTVEGLQESYLVGLSADPVAVSPGPRASWSLLASRPNPFATTAAIDFSLPSPALVTLKVYDVAGRCVATLLDRKHQDAGPQQVMLDGSHLASGVYLARLEVEGRVESRRIVLLRETRGR